MNQQKLVQIVARKTGNSKVRVREILGAALEEIQAQLQKGESVTLSGFGSFLVGRRKAGKGFNPHTGGEMDLPEVRSPKFRPGKTFKDRLNPR